MKALIIAADAATPDYIIDKKELFPNLCRLINTGAAYRYSAYVQKNYNGSYSSEQNWASIYTGLSPSEHGINYRKGGDKHMSEFNGKQPFWEVLNESGLSVGLWQADCCNDPVKIKGYAVSSSYRPIMTPSENREAPRNIQAVDSGMLEFVAGNPPPRLYPRTLKQCGCTFEQLQRNPSLVGDYANEREFQPILDNFNNELAYWFTAIALAQRKRPVDVLYWFTPTTDILPHFTMWCDNNPIIINMYKMLDAYIGAFIDEFHPETVIFMSDHGQQNFKDLIKCSDLNVQREAFSARDAVIWLDNGYIAFEALNGGLLFSAHSLKGIFIASGKGIRHTMADEMRTVDIYPTILEILGAEIPPGRGGYVMDIFDRPLTNADKLLVPGTVTYRKIAIIQTHEVNVMDIVINEIYIANRFGDITIIGENRYEEIFRNNPRVADFVDIEAFDGSGFDEIYCGFCNDETKQIKHIRVK